MNSEQCRMVNASVLCVGGSNEFDSLYRLADLWLKLEQGLPKEKSK